MTFLEASLNLQIVKLIRIVSLLIVVVCASSAYAAKPNVIVVFTDDHGFSDLACQAIQSDLKTPNMDALAVGGVRITSGYVTAPQCVPSRAGLLTGRSQNRFGVESNGMPLDGFNAELTIAERVKKVGYATGMAGKWHLGRGPDIPDHGFDQVFNKNSNRPGWANFTLDGKDCPMSQEQSKQYHLDANSEAACTFIRRHHKRPFFFYCAYRAPHVPLDAPAKYLKRFPGEMPERRRQALAMISAMDDGVGKIMKTLREFDLEKNTMIWVIGDNGAPLKIHKEDAPGGGPGWDGSLNEPFNGEKGMLSEGGIRVPFLVYWKGKIQGGQTYDHPVISLDVAATTNALAGLPADPKLDGVNLVPYLTGELTSAPHEALYWRWVAQSAVREGKWKYLRGGQREYLFDLEADPGEQRNLIDTNSEIATRLSKQLKSWAQQLHPPGLATKPMSSVWDSYYDFYLDGKPAPRKPKAFAGKANDKATAPVRWNDWIGRQCTLRNDNGVLRVKPLKAKKGMFIAASNLSIQPSVKMKLQTRAKTATPGRVQWRESDQKDFPDDQIVEFKMTDEWTTAELKIPNQKKIVHIRIRLPAAGVEIEDVQFVDSNDKVIKRWTFE